MRRQMFAALGLAVVAGGLMFGTPEPAAGDRNGATLDDLDVLGPIDVQVGQVNLDGGVHPVGPIGMAELILQSFDVPEAADLDNRFELVISRTPDPAAPVDALAAVVNAPGGVAAAFALDPALFDVFESDGSPLTVVPVDLETTGNSLLVIAAGIDGTNVRVTIRCVPDPAVNPAVPERSFVLRTLCLATARIDKKVDTILTVRNAGPTKMGVRVRLYDPDGNLVGTSPPKGLDPNARGHVSLTDVAQSIGTLWTRGSVLVHVISQGEQPVCYSALEAQRRDIGPTGDVRARNPGKVRNLKMDDLGFRPLRRSAANKFINPEAGGGPTGD